MKNATGTIMTMAIALTIIGALIAVSHTMSIVHARLSPGAMTTTPYTKADNLAVSLIKVDVFLLLFMLTTHSYLLNNGLINISLKKQEQ
jgi:heme/copper-type cytochrome/quinol oxidase subunit 2